MVFIVLSAEKHCVIRWSVKYLTAHGASLITSTTLQASGAQVAIASETAHSGRHTQEGRRGMCSDTLDLGGEVRGCSVGC